jgi:hypothetical protein
LSFARKSYAQEWMNKFFLILEQKLYNEFYKRFVAILEVLFSKGELFSSGGYWYQGT